MIVALPVNEDQKEICPSFGRAPLFLFYDTDTKQSVPVENPGALAQGGAGLKAAQAVLDGGAAALITPRCGENAAAVLLEGGVSLYKSQGADVAENLKRFAAGALDELTSFHGGYQGIQ